jgi:hypothetical protein
VKRKDGKYTQQTLWYKVLNPAYTQKAGGQDFSKGSDDALNLYRLPLKSFALCSWYSLSEIIPLSRAA